MNASTAGHDRIPEASRWRTCIHEAGHVALVLLTGTTLVRAAAYRHYSSASRRGGQHGYTLHTFPANRVREALIAGAGIVAERLFTDAPSAAILRCTDRLPDDAETVLLCRDVLAVHEPGVLRVASVLREARGSVPGAALARAFRMDKSLVRPGRAS